MKLVEVINLKKHFQSGLFRKRYIKAVDGISFQIAKGETFALAGESGCGKSTVGRCVLHLSEPTSGEIYFKGVNISKLDKAIKYFRKKMQIIFQDADSSLNPRMRVVDLILEPLKVHGLLNGQKRQEALQLMEMVSLPPDILARYPHELSGGQKQRVGIARAIALSPEFVVADEPAASLDISVQAQVIAIMKKLQEELGTAYLFISHNFRVIKIMADKLAVMYLGKFVEVGNADTVLNNPAHPYTQALLSAVPAPGLSARRQRIVFTGEIPSALHPPPGCRFHTRCPKVKKICSEVEPMLCEIENNHLVACHFA